MLLSASLISAGRFLIRVDISDIAIASQSYILSMFDNSDIQQALLKTSISQKKTKLLLTT